MGVAFLLFVAYNGGVAQAAFTHVAYADETSYNRGRYPAVALVSLTCEQAPQVRSDLTHILNETNVDESKWEKLRSAKRRFAALRMIDYAVTQACNNVLRIDVLVWDTTDSRHNIPRLDKIANLQRMYYHLFRNVLRTRWPNTAVWQLCPDEHTAMSWHDVHAHLNQNNTSTIPLPPLLSAEQLKQDFQIHEIVPTDSHQEPLVQLADLFVGMASYSRARYPRFEIWQHDDTPSSPLSHADRERCLIIDALNKQCKHNRLGVSLRTHRGLRTLNPKHPLNFWWYIPQHEADKAPTRKKGESLM